MTVKVTPKIRVSTRAATAVLATVRENPGSPVARIAPLAGISPAITEKALVKFEKLGAVRRMPFAIGNDDYVCDLWYSIW